MGKRKKPAPAGEPRSKAASRTKAAKKERKRPLWRALQYTGLGTLTAVLFIGGAGIGYAASLMKGLPTIHASTFTNSSAASIVYDRNGKVIGRITKDGDRQPITAINQVSPLLVQSFVAAEDKTFYSNIGINPLAMARAVFQDVAFHRIESGASTITQQTVKLAVFPAQQRTLQRKVQEIALAVELNHILSKDEIMTDYMNWVYMGRMGTQNVYGVKTASQILFHKDPSQLSLPEASLLAAIPNNPSLFSPYSNLKHTIDRQHYILNQMLLNQIITQSQYDQAVSYDIRKDIQSPPSNSVGNYPYLMNDEIEPLIVKDLVAAGLYDSPQQAEAALPTAGYKIHTSIDLSIQDHINQVLHDKALFAGTNLPNPYNKKIPDLYEAGVTLIDNQTGAILAIGGGRDYINDTYDHSDIARRPGSSIKPILEYGPAIDLHEITAGTVLDDAPLTFPSVPVPYAPHDDEGFAGLVSARDALVNSRNVPAVSVLKTVTPQVGFEYLAKMGITTDSKTLRGKPTLVAGDANLASAIGGLTHGLTVQQVTSAYTTFANQGIHRTSYLIGKIVDNNGNVAYQFQPQANTVFSPQTAYVMTNILHDVVQKGTAASIGSYFPRNYQISGKTGTTDKLTDGWFVGYTQKYTMGIWMGYNDNQSIAAGPVYNLKFTLWSKMMAPLLQKNPPTTTWQEPPGIISTDICGKSGMLPTDLCKADHDIYSELFIQGTEPTQTDNVHVLVKYVVLNGQKFLATTNTPPADVRTGIFLKPPFPVPAPVPNEPVADSGQYVPTQADPRGGAILQAPTTGSTAISPLASPQNTVAIPAGSSVQISWDPVPTATAYTVWRATSMNGPYTNVAGPFANTSYTDSSLPPGATTLYYEVYAISPSAMSAPSAPVLVQLGNSGGQTGTGGNSTANATAPGGGTSTNSSGNPERSWLPGEGFKSRTDNNATIPEPTYAAMP